MLVSFVFILVSSLFVSYSLISSSYNNWKTLQGKNIVSLISGSLSAVAISPGHGPFVRDFGNRGGEVQLILHVDYVIHLSFSF